MSSPGDIRNDPFMSIGLEGILRGNYVCESVLEQRSWKSDCKCWVDKYPHASAEVNEISKILASHKACERWKKMFEAIHLFLLFILKYMVFMFDCR